MSVNKNNSESVAQYLQSMVKLEELQKMTEDLDKDLEDSQRLMSEIRTIYNTIPEQNRLQYDSVMRRAQLERFFGVDAPQLLIPDMTPAVAVDLDNTLAGIKKYAEDLKKIISVPVPHQEHPNREIGNIDLENYATSLDQLSKRLANIKLNNANVGNNRNTELENKLIQLCEDVNNFTKMIQTKTKSSEANKNWTPNQLDNTTAILYDNMISKLLQGVNEVTLLKNRN